MNQINLNYNLIFGLVIKNQMEKLVNIYGWAENLLNQIILPMSQSHSLILYVVDKN